MFNNKELVLVGCYSPQSHSQSFTAYVAIDHENDKLVRINPRPNIAAVQSFKLCGFLPKCRRKNCTYAHSDIECNAWNFDLQMAKKGKQNKV